MVKPKAVENCDVQHDLPAFLYIINHLRIAA